MAKHTKTAWVPAELRRPAAAQRRQTTGMRLYNKMERERDLLDARIASLEQRKAETERRLRLALKRRAQLTEELEEATISVMGDMREEGDF